MEQKNLIIICVTAIICEQYYLQH